MASVLLVEDDPDLLEIRRMVLEREGHTVFCAADVETALSAPAAGKAIVDLNLPTAEDGCRLIRELHERSPQMELIVVSGLIGEFEHRPESKLVRHILQKPVSTKLLLSILRAP